MSTFAEVHAEWEAARRDAQAAPCAATRLAAEQAWFALRHHPDAHHGRDQLAGRERNRREGRP